MKRLTAGTIGIQALLVLNGFIMLYPLFIMVLSSFKSNAEIFASPFALPSSFDLGNIRRVWDETNFVQYLANSAVITAVSVAVLMFVFIAAFSAAALRILRRREIEL